MSAFTRRRSKPNCHCARPKDPGHGPQYRRPNEDAARVLANEADYFERNRERMRYPEFRRQGLFVGSGVVEAGCRTVIGARLKRSGMFWTVRGANAIIALCCCRLSGEFEDYWEARARAA